MAKKSIAASSLPISITIIQRKLSDLISAEYNPRKLSDSQKKHISDSIKRFGFVDPILVNTHPSRKNIIIGGHQRTKVAAELGMTEVPCVELSLTLDQEKELNIRLNKNTGEFDFDLLAEHFEKESLMEWGFEDADFPVIIEAETQEDEFVMPEKTKTDIVLGDLIKIGAHRLLCGDSTDVKSIERLLQSL